MTHCSSHSCFTDEVMPAFEKMLGALRFLLVSLCENPVALACLSNISSLTIDRQTRHGFARLHHKMAAFVHFSQRLSPALPLVSTVPAALSLPSQYLSEGGGGGWGGIVEVIHS